MADNFLSFEIADELYAVPIGKVREILGGLPKLARVPNAPPFLRGLMSLRGTVMPLVDLRMSFGLTARKETEDRTAVVLVTEVVNTVVGLLVDNVVDVVSVAQGDIQLPPPNFNARVRVEYVTGLTKCEDRLLVLIDLDSILTNEQIGILKSATAA